MRKKTVAFNGTIINVDRSDGFSRVTCEIAKTLHDKYDDILIYTNKRNEMLFQASKSVDIVNTNITYSGSNFKGHFSRFLWHQTKLPLSLRKNAIKLYFSPIPDGMLFPPCKQIITIYDLVPILFPESSPRIKYYYKYILPRIIDSSFAIIAGSESTKTDILKYFKNITCPIYVIYPGYKTDIFFKRSKKEIENIKQKYTLNRYVVAVGELRPYKNIRQLVKAFSDIRSDQYDLVIVGRKSKLEKDFNRVPFDLNAKNKIKYLGYVSDIELAALYSGAETMVHPSLYEGFGLPPLEAMACGCPAIVSNSSSIPEVCANAGYYFDPYSLKSMTDAINEVLENSSLRNNMIEQGLKQAHRFSFEKMANNLIHVFNMVS